MKHTFFLILLTGFFCYQGLAQEDGDQIVGKWLKLPKKDMIIEVFKSNEAYHGKISWIKPGDDKPVGFVIIENLKYNTESNTWEDGKIVDPNSSRSYSAEVKVNEEGDLIVKGYKGAKFISSSRTFERVKG